jgi:hypothetical protein
MACSCVLALAKPPFKYMGPFEGNPGQHLFKVQYREVPACVPAGLCSPEIDVQWTVDRTFAGLLEIVDPDIDITAVKGRGRARLTVTVTLSCFNKGDAGDREVPAAVSECDKEERGSAQILIK